MKEFKLIISTPEGNAYEGNVEKLCLRGIEGDLAILADHVPFVTVVKEGSVSITHNNGDVTEARCRQGILTVSSGETVLLTSFFQAS